MDATKTGALIAAIRRERNMTQAELAARLHVTDKAVSKWERGAGLPDISLIEPLAAALDISVLELMQGRRIPRRDRPPHRGRSGADRCPRDGKARAGRQAQPSEAGRPFSVQAS